MADLNSRPVARYLAFMFVAGVNGCYGVIDANGILIVGVMAVSPDLLPVTAIAVSLVGRNSRLTWDVFLTLTFGLALASAAAAIFTFTQHRLRLIPSSFNIDATALGSLTTVNNETLLVALAAGWAAPAMRRARWERSRRTS